MLYFSLGKSGIKKGMEMPCCMVSRKEKER